jgi:hypothetical protein
VPAGHDLGGRTSKARVFDVGFRGLKVAFQSRGLDTPRGYKVTLQALSRDLKVGLEENVKVISLGKRAARSTKRPVRASSR